MKNLDLTNVINYQLGINKKVERFCVDSKLGNVYVYENGNIGKITLHNGKETTSVNLVEYYHNKEKIPKLVGMNYLESSEAICFLFNNGDILLYATMMNDLQCVGIVSTGVKAIAWSPDEEIFALITGEDNVIVMTSSFDPVNEVFLHQNNTGEKQFITLGWGKKETQFHGSEGKAAAQVAPQSCRPVFSWDDCQPRVSWRGDGELFVVSTIVPDLNHRQLRFFNREGMLQCTSEPVDGLEAPVCWKPSGALIAAVQRLPNKYMVIFFEKNGLRHGEFSLPFKPDEMMVKDLSWNADSTLLAVCCESLNGDGDMHGSLQLWAVNNYHWYLKKVLNYDPYGKFIDFSWDINHVYRLHLLCGSSFYACHDYSWKIDHSKGKTEEDSAYVAVIDGDKLLVTPFRQTVVPPPMSSYTIQLPLPVSDVVFAPPFLFAGSGELDNLKKQNQTSRYDSNNFFVILMDNSIIFFSHCENMIEEYNMNDGSIIRLTEVGADGFKSVIKYHMPIGRFILDLDNVTKEQGKNFINPPLLRHWQWISESLIFCCFANGLDTCICVIEFSETSSDANNIGQSFISLLGSVVAVAVSFKEGNTSAIMQLKDGTLMSYAFSSGCMSSFTKSNGQPMGPLPVFTKMEICTISGEDFILGLTSKNRFYVNDKEVLSDCSSFFIHSEYLLLTTYHHRLMNILLEKDSIEHFAAKKWETNTSENVRRIERGSRLIVAVPKHYKVILQMPRGNVECIQPRALSLHIISDLVKRRKYGKAFDLIRTQRINLNVLCDLHPQEFMRNLNEFVVQVKNPNWLSLFLCELQPENVLETMYSGFNYLKIAGRNEELENKLNMICDGLREAMEVIDEEGYFLPILTSYVMKKTKEDLVSALKRVRSIKEQTIERKVEISSDEALKYLIYLVDVDTLYDAALGIYDFDLVMMIAAKSSKDPKEYIPFINELRKLETNYQHYKIDMHLKSYSSALKNIAKCGDEYFVECLNLIKSQKLYRDALKLFPKGGKFYMLICDAYADHLLEDRLFEEAGIMQKLSNNFEKAIVSFKTAGNWRQTLILAKELQYNQSQMSKLCRDLSSELKDRRKFSDAAFILIEYLGDHEECIESLTNGCLWEEAIRVAYHCDRLDLIETHVKPGMKEHFDSLMGRFNGNSDVFLKYKTRLAVVRAEKSKSLQESEEKGNETNVADDLVSEASSVIGSAIGSSFHSSSRGSSRSSRSSKNRRKQERKFLSLKEGNPYEELALMTALKNLFDNAFSQETKDEVRGLCVVLVLYGQEELAAQLQDLLNSMQREMTSSRDEIWEMKHSEEHMQFGPLCTSNAISALASSHNLSKMTPHTMDLVHIPPVTKTDSLWKLNIL